MACTPNTLPEPMQDQDEESGSSIFDIDKEEDIIKAIWKGDLSYVKKYIDEQTIFGLQASNGWSPNECALRSGHVEMARYFDSICVPQSYSMRPLKIAIETRQPEMVRYVLKNRWNYPFTDNHERHQSDKKEIQEILATLYRFTDAFNAPQVSDTIHQTAEQYYTTIISNLIKQGLSFKLGSDGQSPLHLCMQHQNYLMASLLIKSGFDCTIANEEDENALEFAIVNNYPNIPSSLIDLFMQCDDINLSEINFEKCNDICSAIEIATFNENLSLLKYLVENHFEKISGETGGIKILKRSIGFALEKDNLDIFIYLIGKITDGKPEKLEQLLRDPEVCNDDFATPLFVNAAFCGALKIVKYIFEELYLSKNIAFDHENNENAIGYSAIECLASDRRSGKYGCFTNGEDKDKVLRYLISIGIHVNTPVLKTLITQIESNGCPHTAHSTNLCSCLSPNAVQERQSSKAVLTACVKLFEKCVNYPINDIIVESVNELLAQGASLTQRGITGNTPLLEAAVAGNKLIVIELLEANASIWDKNTLNKANCFDLAEKQGHVEVMLEILKHVIQKLMKTPHSSQLSLNPLMQSADSKYAKEEQRLLKPLDTTELKLFLEQAAKRVIFVIEKLPDSTRRANAYIEIGHCMKMLGDNRQAYHFFVLGIQSNSRELSEQANYFLGELYLTGRISLNPKKVRGLDEEEINNDPDITMEAEDSDKGILFMLKAGNTQNARDMREAWLTAKMNRLKRPLEKTKRYMDPVSSEGVLSLVQELEQAKTEILSLDNRMKNKGKDFKSLTEGLKNKDEELNAARLEIARLQGKVEAQQYLLDRIYPNTSSVSQNTTNNSASSRSSTDNLFQYSGHKRTFDNISPDTQTGAQVQRTETPSQNLNLSTGANSIPTPMTDEESEESGLPEAFNHRFTKRSKQGK